MSLSSFKGAFVGFLLILTYSNMVLDIILITKVRHGSDVRPPAVIAHLVAVILQMLWCLYYLIRGGMGRILIASNVLAVTVFFWCFEFACTVAYTTLRHHSQYCAPTAINAADCSGVLRGVEGLGWSLIGVNLIYIIFLIALVSSQGTWNSEMNQMPSKKSSTVDVERAEAY
ncbi:hypothetical protein M231_01435 [Tremella mesenterica]|uniref:MARVEL domain-containing protein n=1 Tax=Tremella mesenterica TaxID=5217 RepID=A0A4Q1BTE3_TREME|nr:hypothetical protein M231_01435 [Tremella mesenterica]